MKLKALLAMAVVLLLAGCGGPTAGKIQDKRHQAGYSYTTMQCTGSRCIPIPHYQPPLWAFDLYADNGDHGWHRVDAGTYDEYAIGDYYDEDQD
jgi:hypothetical protein